MKNAANFVLFQVAWFAAVIPAANGNIWMGPLAVGAFIVVHLALTPASERAREFAYVALAGVFGAAADAALCAHGVTSYPTSNEAWPYVVPPPWIISLWVAFAALPRFSLGWLRGRTWLAVIFGAIGGPLSYLGGSRLGAVAVNEEAWITITGLAVEYAVVTPVLLALSPAPPRNAEAPAEAPTS